MKNGHKRNQVNFRVTGEDDKALTTLSRALGMSRSDVIRSLIQTAMSKLTRKEIATRVERSVQQARLVVFDR